MTLAALVENLRSEARRTNERRLLVLAGDRDAGIDAAYAVIEDAGADAAAVAFVTTREGFKYERYAPTRADGLLGTTREVIVLDCHDEFSPNALGQVTGAVDGGGLVVLLTPPLDSWPDRRDAFDERLAVPPFGLDDVTGRFRSRLVETLRSHPGIAIVELGADGDRETVTDGLTESKTRVEPRSPRVPANAAFPTAVYEACLTADQARAVAALERLANPGHAVVLEADRGRGKSSAAGLAAGALAAMGRRVLVTAPAFRNAAELFDRARELLAERGSLADTDETDEARLETDAGGWVRFEDPVDAASLPADPDLVVVDEAAALPVRLLSEFLAAPSVAFCTTVHGYEGAGRGFSVRFRARLDESPLRVTAEHLEDPIRYARDDPIEGWLFRALLLDARPPVDQLVAAATPETVSYRSVSPDELLADEHRLREAFGLLVLAHYRTEPNDLVRLLDAPNLSLRALTRDGHVVSVALLAREGGFDAETRKRVYLGERIRGNMLPDVLTSQLRDEAAGAPVGYRVVRIATHHAVRSTGLGSSLLDAVHAEFGDAVDWFGVGYGATPELLCFWRRNGYRTVHVSTTRNATSGEYSALMLRSVTPAGEALATRHGEWFAERIRDVLTDALRDLDPDVARGALRATDAEATIDLSDRDWRMVAGAAGGPGLYDMAPGGFRTLALAHLLDPTAALTVRQERLLVRKVLQGHPWSTVADELGYYSASHCMRSLGELYVSLLEAIDEPVATRELERYDP
ncbi:tRNA(Met) cytidine acetyltransferase TmcA [Haloferacaceae archaeon DSL9]